MKTTTIKLTSDQVDLLLDALDGMFPENMSEEELDSRARLVSRLDRAADRLYN